MNRIGICRAGAICLRWGCVAAAVWLVRHLHTPQTGGWQAWDHLALAGLLLPAAGGLRHARSGLRRLEALLLGVFVVMIAACAVSGTYWRQRQRLRVLGADRAQLRLAGAHFIIGFDAFQKIRPLAASGAIAGIYLTRRNVAGLSVQQIRARMDALQTLRQQAGLTPLIVAADQEGGLVSHLSPPLPSQPPLATLVGAAVSRRDLARSTAAYARRQAAWLVSAGVNLNLSPVVDLPADGAWLQGSTRLQRRAIADDKETVAEMAQVYCRSMNHAGVWPTLKHFPGLGQVAEETHRQGGNLDLPLDALSVRDWVPFRQVIAHTQAFLMLGHVRLRQVDAQHLVCTSPAVIQEILRHQWHFNGILITDDLDMGAVRQSGGIGRTAVQALNAGVDLLLISYDGRQYYPAMAAVLDALEQGDLDLGRLAQSRRRLEGLWPPNAIVETAKADPWMKPPL